MSAIARLISTEFKLAYLFAVVIALLFVPSLLTVVVLLALQTGLWIACSLGWRPLVRVMKRLALFFLIITASYAFFSLGETEADRWIGVTLGPWTIAINLAGVSFGLLMCLRVSVLVLASVWVQQSGSPDDFARALERLRVPRFIAASIDGTIQLASGGGGMGGGGGGGRGQGKGGMSKREMISIGFDQLRHGKLTFLTQMIERGLDRAEHFVARSHPDMNRDQAKDTAVIVAIAAVIMGTKVLQVLPGIPIAPGHKNVVIIPLLLLASGLTRARFGGLWTGLTAGIVSVLSGYGQYGVLEIAHFAAPGLMADFLLPLVRLTHPAWLRFIEFGVIGALLGMGRFTANFLVILLAGAPKMALALYLPMLVSQMAFGTLSAFVSLSILDLLARRSAPDVDSAIGIERKDVDDSELQRAQPGTGRDGSGRRPAI